MAGSRRRSICLLGFAAAIGGAGAARADDVSMALALRTGTNGIGLDYDVGFNPYLSVRVGYTGGRYDIAVDTSDATYSGSIKPSMAEALVDWYPSGGGFHLTGGATSGNTRIDVTGVPGPNGFTINDHTYTRADVSSVNGSAKYSNSVAPYIGLGWGKSVGTRSHLHFLFDIGAIYGGKPKVSLNAVCGPAASVYECALIQSDVQSERAKLQRDADSNAQWYPVFGMGLAYRF
jgi:hypothetical protein